MHLLATLTTAPDYDSWKAVFDAHGEDRDQSGLTLLQLWRDLDAPAIAVALFEVHDRAAAEGWVSRQTALHGPVEARFVRTA